MIEADVRRPKQRHRFSVSSRNFGITETLMLLMKSSRPIADAPASIWLSRVSVKRNAEFVKNHVAEWLAGFPHLRFTLERMIAEGDQVVSQMVMKGTHAGTWLGIAPTGKEVSIPMIVIHRIVNGRIAEEWVACGVIRIFPATWSHTTD